MVQPVNPPVSPMLAKLARDLPIGAYLYEPKWDGFRAIVFRDGADVEIGSRNQRPLTRYFPDLVDPLRASLPEKCVVDGEIVIATDRGLDFDLLSLRIHPAASRIATLAAETPASFVGFDLLAEGTRDLRREPFVRRRSRLEVALAGATPPVLITPATTDPQLAREWFERFEGAGLDGVIAKPLAGQYLEGKRAMVKVKHQRSADCVVAGYREHAGGGVGSLLLGVFDHAGVLHHVGVASSFTADLRARLAKELEPYRDRAPDDHPWKGWSGSVQRDPVCEGDTQRVPGGPSRWNAGKDLSWEPVRVELVAEVTYEHLQAGRFRHTARFMRWRPDREPASCTYAQLDVPVPIELREVFGV